ncbi:unnamed protein product [Ectocarpus fasciculatus]
MSSSYRKDGNVATNNLGMRKSCGECGRKKRKCDGLAPCSRCLGAGVRCTYSKRKPHQPQNQHQHQRRPRGPSGKQAAELLRPSASGTLLGCGMLPLKRLKMSASPATGLVGMQENAFLSYFFGCVGFLPFTTRSHIRGAMVRMMTRSTAQHRPGAPQDSPDQAQFGDIVSTGYQLSTGPSACTFWCAVGIGALVKGSHVESVANYCRLARHALDAYTGSVDAEVAEACVILGYLYGFMGDTATFEQYLKLSGSFLMASIEAGSTDMLPTGFAEIINYKECAKVYSGNVDTADIDSFGPRHQDPPQINRAASEEDVFRYVAQSLEVFVQFVVEKACENRATRICSSDDGPCGEDRGGASPHGNDPPVEEMSDAMLTWFKAGLLEFEILQEAVDRRPNVRTGIGGLLINVNLVFHRAVNGDAFGVLEKLGHIVEVFERYPGVSRCMLHWGHLAHAALAALAAMDDCRARGLYNRLREAYNPSRPPTSLPAPPLEEWQGLSTFCDHFLCRLVEGIIASESLSVFSTPRGCCGNLKEEDGPAVDEQHHSGIVWAGVTPENMSVSIMDALASNGIKPMTSTSSSEWNHEYVPLTTPPARSSPSTPHDDRRESGKGETHGTDLISDAVEGVFSGVVDQFSDIGFTSPELREVDGATQETVDDAIAVADWLDATHAMLDAIGDKSPGV